MTASLRVVVAPDAFVGLLSATEVAEAVTVGWAREAPADRLELVPLSDGGPGFAAVMTALGGRGVADEGTAYVDGADVMVAGDAAGGTGELGRRVSQALAGGARRVVVGVAGGLESRSDAGYGALLALGALDRGGELDLTPALSKLVGVDLVIATDVDDTAAAPPAWLPSTARDLAARDGAGAQADLGLGLMALGATRVNASQLVIDAAGLGETIGRPTVADLVITGERVVGWHSRRGRVLAGVARTAVTWGAPVVALCVDVQIGRRETANLGLEAVYAIAPPLLGPTFASSAATAVSVTAARVARTWSRAELR